MNISCFNVLNFSKCLIFFKKNILFYNTTLTCSPHFLHHISSSPPHTNIEYSKLKSKFTSLHFFTPSFDFAVKCNINMFFKGLWDSPFKGTYSSRVTSNLLWVCPSRMYLSQWKFSCHTMLICHLMTRKLACSLR